MCQSDNSEAAVILRAMEPADVTFLTDLWVASWRETMPAIDFESRRDWLAACLRDPAHETLVAAGADGRLGFATWEASYLHQLVAAPGAKGGGLAVRLLAAVKAARPAGLALDVNQANARALRFYAREGFVTDHAGRNPASGLATWHMRWQPVDVSDRPYGA